MLEALKKTHGIAVHAAPMAGIERSTHIRWMQKDATYRAKVEEFQEEALDRAEAVVEAAMAQQRERPDLALKSAVFLLENKGTRRGYGKAAINLQVNQAVSNAQAGPVFQIKQMLDEAAKKEAQNTSKQ